MSALGAVESPVATPGRESQVRSGGRSQLRLVRQAASAGVAASIPTATDSNQPRFSSMAPRVSSMPQSTQSGVASAPLRLTRRGRIVVAILTSVIAVLAILVIALAASGGAQAANHGQSGGAYQGMHQIVVQPGQTLWAIASSAEPSVDPRVVIQQIITVNALTGSDIHVGQVLWVPR